MFPKSSEDIKENGLDPVRDTNVEIEPSADGEVSKTEAISPSDHEEQTEAFLLSDNEDQSAIISSVDDVETVDGRVVHIGDDHQDIIIPDGPSKLEGEVLLVRRPDTQDKSVNAGVKVKRVKADRNERYGEDEPHGALYSFLDTLRFISLGLLVGILLVVFVVQRNDVYGSSMEPTLYNRDAVFVEMISVYLDNYKRGDIVTIDAEGMEGYYHKENIIKRIIGLPGETVTIVDGLVYINGNLLVEPYITEGVMTYVSAEGEAKGYDQVVLGTDEYFCLGDNRGASNDSRRLGPISAERIKSHVIARIYPFDTIELF